MPVVYYATRFTSKLVDGFTVKCETLQEAEVLMARYLLEGHSAQISWRGRMPNGTRISGVTTKFRENASPSNAT